MGIFGIYHFSLPWYVSEGIKMKRKCVDKLIGKYCKIVTKEPGEEKSYVVVGTVKDVDHDAGFITIESAQGLSCLSINTIIAIKPKAEA
ncbi:MAG: hypothetical protein KAW45_09670 [Thermoplasmatales archaeon]|nr:hypothetical protein [Thermoplasmatales archaeon]